MSKAVLIFGATGKQGGAVINQLLQRNADFKILAVTRDAKSASAQKLLQKSKNIALVEGNAQNPGPIFASAKSTSGSPVWGVFSVQGPVGKEEETQGKAIIDEALKSGVKFFVYTSVDRHGDDSLTNPTDVPHFITKHNIEHHLINRTKGADMAWTILRPTAFFENFTPDFFGKVFTTAWRKSLKGKPLQLIATADIGSFAVDAFLNPEAWNGKQLTIGGDELTFEQMAKIFKEETGKEVPETYEFIASLLMYFVKELGHMFRWFHVQGYGANIQELRKVHPELKDFRSWLRTESRWIEK